MTYTVNSGEQGYLDLLQHILDNGTDKTDRTGVGTRSIFGAQLRFDLDEGFPLFTTKKVWPKGVFGELAWLISGSTNIGPMVDQGIHIWNEWADENGDLGPVYGKQWRKWNNGEYGSIDQLQNALDLIKNNPHSRRIIVSAWNPPDVPNMKLPPCHMTFQFEVHDGKLSCHMYMRSADVFLGVPFNVASYAALTHVMASLAGLEIGELIVSFGDVHIYNNLFDQVKEQLTRTPRPLPTMWIHKDVYSLEDVETNSFLLEGYDPYPAIKGEVAV